uniref:Photosystem I reaction centre subunit XI n=1 Tax=Phaeostrophion irregulare TaxID=243268 RepID=UPI002E78A646|nr:Photosystem I reaction centre subunit XI [Phaeostrophion irregulare]WAM64295.1 Photosystem I reaction centre subunit XI [Phaeostrophion irregulare]
MTSFIKPYNDDPSVGHLSTPITSSAATKAYLGNLPIYRKGLSPLLRGIEIGMAHGYLLVGPFQKLGPLRDSEIALLVGFLSSIALVTLLTICLTMYGKVTFQEYDKINENEEEWLNKRNWNRFTSGFFIGSFGGSSFAYLILLNL